MDSRRTALTPPLTDVRAFWGSKFAIWSDLFDFEANLALSCTDCGKEQGNGQQAMFDSKITYFFFFS